MKFVAPADKALDFKLGPKVYKVPAGGVVDIPEQFVFAVKKMGLLLTEYVEPAAKPEPEPKKSEGKQPVAKGEAPTPQK